VENRITGETKKKPRYSAAAFDLDGTLYPNWRFYLLLLPFIIREQRYLRAFGKARNRLRAEEGIGEPSLYERQARYMGEILRTDPSLLAEKTERLIYRGWEPLFKKVRLFPFAKETLQALKDSGVKLGLLSDFPPRAKLDNLGLSGLWDTVLCSEELGKLKPDPLPFRELAHSLGVPAEEILYVGNSFPYDVLGSKRAGMKAAWVTSYRNYRKKPGGGVPGEADFVFYDYRQLRDYVLL
jgi:putative hydrolase of the HAD superfamily